MVITEVLKVSHTNFKKTTILSYAQYRSAQLVIYDLSASLFLSVNRILIFSILTRVVFFAMADVKFWKWKYPLVE
jgi:hypothetical protein